MRIDVKFDTSALKVKTEREIKRLAYNTAQALNETAKAVQLEERANLDRKFTIRKPTFMYRLIKIFKFASARQGRPFVEIGIDTSKQRALLSFFEKGGIKKPVKGKSVGVPVTGEAARPTFRQSVIPQLQIGKLRFRGHKTKRGKIQWKGLYRTFIIPLGNYSTKPMGSGWLTGGRPKHRKEQIPGPGILQRTTAGIRRIYLFVRRPKLQQILKFSELAIKTINKEWPEQFRRAYRK